MEIDKHGLIRAGNQFFIGGYPAKSETAPPENIESDYVVVSRRLSIQFRVRWNLFKLVASVILLVAAKDVSGQEALRLSQAGDLAAESQQRANSTIGYYNLLLGPTAWRFSSGLGTEFNDNVRSQPHGESDFILLPRLDTQIHWPVTLKNSLDISLGAGYSQYLQHQDLSQFFITPGSGLSFDVYVGDFKINLHDRITITQYSYQNPGVNGGNQNQINLQNTIGTSALWDLDQVVANFGFDHVNYASLASGQNSQPDSASENIFVNTGIRVRPELLIGLEAGGTLINYSQTTSTNTYPTPNAVQWSTGVFGSAKVSDYIDVRLDAGFTDYIPEHTGTNQVTQNSSGLYFSFTLTHRVNQFMNYNLSAGRSTDLSAYGQAQNYTYVNLNPNWNLFKKYTVSTPVSWRQGTRVNNYATGGNSADYQQLQLGLTVGRSLTQKLSASIGYQFVRETSGEASLNYTVDIVSLNLNYRF